jgi:hypothetical protein
MCWTCRHSLEVITVPGERKRVSRPSHVLAQKGCRAHSRFQALGVDRTTCVLLRLAGTPCVGTPHTSIVLVEDILVGGAAACQQTVGDCATFTDYVLGRNLSSFGAASVGIHVVVPCCQACCILAHAPS